jgi:O-antigen ligase
MKRLELRTGQNTWEKLLSISLPLCLFFSMVSISLVQIFLSLSIIFWVAKVIKNKERLAFPGFFLPLVSYAALSILSSVFSVNPGISFFDSRELLLFLVVPVTYTAFSRTKDFNRMTWALLASGYLAALYSLFYKFFEALPGERIRGFMGHYMTEAGILLLFCSLALSIVFFSREKSRWLWALALVLALFCLVLTMTRSAWIGFFVVVGFVLVLYKPITLVLVPVLAGLLFLASPQSIKNRALSIFDPGMYSNQERIEYFKAGIQIIKEHPLLGTGPDTVDMVFKNPKYGLTETAKRNVHLHNNFIQIAAERGIPTLLVWLVFLIWTFLSLLRLLRNKTPALYPLTAGALAVLVALVTAGFFEYNFADSEITILFLFLITAPFAYLRLLNKGEGA